MKGYRKLYIRPSAAELAAARKWREQETRRLMEQIMAAQAAQPQEASVTDAQAQEVENGNVSPDR